jgi:hypothetical protein
MTARRPRRTAVVAALAVGAAALVPAALATPQASALDLVRCTAGWETVTFSPPLTTTPQLVTGTTTGTYDPCVVVSGLSVTSRTSTHSGTTGPSTRTCNDLLTSRLGQRVIHWSTGATSTFTFTGTVNTVGGDVLQALMIGTITAGEFEGLPATAIVLLTASDLDACATTGVRALSGLSTITIGI